MPADICQLPQRTGHLAHARMVVTNPAIYANNARARLNAWAELKASRGQSIRSLMLQRMQAAPLAPAEPAPPPAPDQPDPPAAARIATPDDPPTLWPALRIDLPVETGTARAHEWADIPLGLAIGALFATALIAPVLLGG